MREAVEYIESIFGQLDQREPVAPELSMWWFNVGV
jgi:hypothetical protein